MKTFLSIIIVALLIWGGCRLFSNSEETVAEYRSRIEQKLNTELNNPSNSVRRRVESAHGTVLVKSANISAISVRTKDNSDNAGENGSNVSELKVTVMTRWDGILHKDGYTEFNIVYDMSAQKPYVKEAGIVKTNAQINFEDPNFWFSVGSILLLLI